MPIWPLADWSAGQFATHGIIDYGVWPFKVSCRIEGRNSVKRTVRFSYLFPLTAMLAWILHKVRIRGAHSVDVAYRAPHFGPGIVSSNCTLRNRPSIAKLSLLRRNEVVLPRSNETLAKKPVERNESYEMFSATREKEEFLPLVCSPPTIPPTRVLILPAGLNPLMRVARRLDRISLHRGLSSISPFVTYSITALIPLGHLMEKRQ